MTDHSRPAPAMDLCQDTQAFRACELQYLRVLCTCGISITLFASVLFLWWLRGVLVPVTFAVFLAFLCEPLLRIFVLGPENLARFARWCCSWPAQVQAEAMAAAEGLVASFTAGSLPLETAQRCGRHCCRPLAWLQGFWDFVAVIFCCIAVFGPLCVGVYATVAVLTSFDWEEYENSPKWHQLENFLEHVGIIKSDKGFDPAALWNIFKSELMSAASSVINFSESMLLTILIYLFCLLAMLPGIHARTRHSEDVQGLVQQYLLRKTGASLIIALLVTAALQVMRVPLPLFFGVLTFFLNYIPNIGSLIAILFPVPLVWLNPQSTLIHVVLVVVVQFLVHNIAGQVIEPAMLSQGLDLHPLTIVVALTFWGSIWGIAGTVLSVPLTCVLRLWLGRHEHPLARHIHAMFDDPLGPGAGPRPAPGVARARYPPTRPASWSPDLCACDSPVAHANVLDGRGGVVAPTGDLHAASAATEMPLQGRSQGADMNLAHGHAPL